MASEVIAIDGPSASGKSTVARRVAAALGWTYVDSGAMYRGVTWKALQDSVDTADSAAVAALVQASAIEVFVQQGAVRFTVDGTDPGAQIRSPAVNEHVSPVSAVPAVRARITALLRDATRFGNLVVEGRDIGTVVFPEAKYKFYIDASAEERARRRHAEMDAKGAGSRDDVARSLSRRDTIDSGRKVAPLRIPEDAVVVDSTALTIEKVVELVLKRVERQ
jgi:cytidylate kinase